mgnify:CR=1 FL=1
MGLKNNEEERPPHPEIASGRFRSLAMTFQGVGHGMMGKGEASRMIRY